MSEARKILQAAGCEKCQAPVLIMAGRHSTGVVRITAGPPLHFYPSRARESYLRKCLAEGRVAILCRSCCRVSRGQAA